MADNQTEKQKVQELTDKMERGLTELFNSDSYKNYLSTMSKFHNYSFNNTLLIAMQKPDASLVTGYKTWQKNFDRHVNKGEKAIRILAPAPYKIKEERDKVDPVTQEIMLDRDGNPQKEGVEITIPAFRAVSVFDVSQTDGKPIPELEAESIVYTVCQHFGVDTSEYSFGYIAGWSSGRDTEELVDMKERKAIYDKAMESIHANDVIVKFASAFESEWEVLKITNLSREDVGNLLKDMAALDEYRSAINYPFGS